MKQRPCGSIIDIADIIGKGFQPPVEGARRLGVRDRQGIHSLLLIRAPDAAQHARGVMRCQAGAHRPMWIPALRSSAARRTASGTRGSLSPQTDNGLTNPATSLTR